MSVTTPPNAERTPDPKTWHGPSEYRLRFGERWMRPFCKADPPAA